MFAAATQIILSPVELCISLVQLIGSVQCEVALGAFCVSHRVPVRFVRAAKFCTVSTAATGFALVPRYDQLSVC